jgi:hypothetical protein
MSLTKGFCGDLQEELILSVVKGLVLTNLGLTDCSSSSELGVLFPLLIQKIPTSHRNRVLQ